MGTLITEYFSYLIIGIMIFIFIWYGRKLLYVPYVSIKRSNEAIDRKLSEIKQLEDISLRFIELDKWVETLPKNDYLGKCFIPSWKSYNKKFVNLKQNGVVFIPDVYDFFVEDNFVNKYGRRKLVEVIPGIFLALGIIGTFFGIATGVSGLEPGGDSDSMKKGIEVLLGGMQIKFASSIIGILLSGIWQILDKRLYYPMLTESFHNIRQILDETFPTQEESIVLYQMFKNQEKQITDFQCFLTDVMIPNMVSGFSQSINQSLTPHLEQTHSLMSDMVKNANSNQLEGMNTMVDHFVTSLSEITGEHMKGLGEALQTTIEWQKRVHSEMSDLVQSMQESAVGQSQMVEKTTSLTEQIHGFTDKLTNYQEVFVNTIEQLNETTEKNSIMQNSISELLNKMTEERVAFDKYFTDHLEKLKENVEIVITQTGAQTILQDKLEANISNMDSLTDTQHRLAGTLEEHAETQQRAHKEFSNLLELMNQHSEKYANLQEGLNTTTEKNSTLQETITHLLDKMVEERQLFHQYFNQHLGHLENNVGAIVSQTEQQVNVQNKLELNLQQILDLTATQQNLAESLSKQANLSLESNSTLNGLLEKIETHGSMFGELQDELKDTLKSTIKERHHLDEMMNDLYSGLTDQLKQLDSRSESLKQFWGSQKDVLQGLNKQLGQSMNQFTSDMHLGLEKTFVQFDEELSKSVQYLSKGVNAIQEGIIDLPEAMDTLKKSVKELNKYSREMVKTGE